MEAVVLDPPKFIMPPIQPDPNALRAAHMAELLHRPTSDAAHNMIEALLGLTLAAEESVHGPRERQRTKAATDALRATMAALARDLLDASTDKAAEGFCFRPERSPTFTRTLATFRQYATVRDAWLALDLMERVSGIRHGMAFGDSHAQVIGKAAGRSPRLRATVRLLNLARAHGITPEALGTHYERSHDPTYPVVLRRVLPGSRGSRRASKSTVPITRTDEADRIAKEVRARLC